METALIALTNTLKETLVKYPKMLPVTVTGLVISHCAMWYTMFAEKRDIVKEFSGVKDKICELRVEASKEHSDIRNSIIEAKLQSSKEMSAVKDQISELKELFLKSRARERGWFF